MEYATHEPSNHDRADNAHFTGNPVCDELHPMSMKGSARRAATCRALSVLSVLERVKCKKRVDKTLRYASITSSETKVLMLHFPKTSRVAALGGLLFGHSKPENRPVKLFLQLPKSGHIQGP